MTTDQTPNVEGKAWRNVTHFVMMFPGASGETARAAKATPFFTARNKCRAVLIGEHMHRSSILIIDMSSSPHLDEHGVALL